MREYVADNYKNEQRSVTVPQALVYIGYIAMVAVIVALSIKLGKYVDIIDAKSNISGAFIGGVMLAAVTSLPELFTSLSAVWIVRENSMIIGNILGSDLINLAFFGVILLISAGVLKKRRFPSFTTSRSAWRWACTRLSR